MKMQRNIANPQNLPGAVATRERTPNAIPRCAELLFGMALICALAVTGCGGNDKASQLTSFSTAESPQAKAELFSLPTEQMSHIQIVTVTPAPLMRTLRLTGSVDYNAFKTTPVISQVGGPISRIVVAPGERVETGQPMLYVASPDYSQQRSAYIKARTALELADKSYKRAQDLYDHHAIAEADLEQAQSTRNQAQADMDASTDSMRVLGITDPQTLVDKPSSPEVPLLAPVSGEVVDRLCSPGQLLAPGTTQCFTLSDTSTVWILANVYQNDLAYVHVGDDVTVEDDAYPGQMHGKIQYIAPAFDPTTRTVQARIEAANPNEHLKRSMYVTVEVHAGTIANAIAMPDSAILRDDQNMPYVYINTGTNQFARREVTVGESQNGKTQVLTGLAPGDQVVGDGSLFLQFQNSLQR